jgi:hypothetical protein
MSIRAGSIVTVAGRNVVDRLQSAGLGDARIPIETVREIGNDLVVDKVPGEADFTFSMESWDVSTDLLAFLHGKIGNQVANQPPGYADAAGTGYNWEDCQFVNITSPWKRNVGSAGGNIAAGLLIPGYYPTRLRYRFGVTDNAVQEVELAGGAFYYAQAAPVEEVAAGDGIEDTFPTSEAARALRLGGPAGTTFQRVFGVLVNGSLQIRGVDYTESVPGPTPAGDPAITTITFAEPPPDLAQIRFVYFTETAKAYPQAVNADATIKPGAVRGRNIVILFGERGVDQVRLPGVQTVELEATIDGEVEREMGNPEITGRVVNGTDVTGTVTIRPKDIAAFFNTLSLVTGRSDDEVFDFANFESAPVEIQIQNPKDPGTILKTIYIEDGQFQPPGTPARVNQATDFGFQFNSVNGTFTEYKGARP